MAAFTVAPRTESELVQHIEHSSGVKWMSYWFFLQVFLVVVIP